jgi:CheY-like chemotaxis protein
MAVMSMRAAGRVLVVDDDPEFLATVREQAHAIGAAAALEKPFTMEDLPVCLHQTTHAAEPAPTTAPQPAAG